MIVFAISVGIVGLGILYAVIYLAVKHGIEDSKLLKDLHRHLTASSDKIDQRHQ